MENFVFEQERYLNFSQKYFDLLQNEFKGINLTAIDDFNLFYIKQIKDSLIPLQISKIFFKDVSKANYVLDIGFGGGFPILPLAFVNHHKKFIGIESKEKKVKVVSEIAQLLEIKNIKLLHQRIENVLIDVDNIVVTFKAVGQTKEFLEKLNVSKKIQNVQVYFYKGPNYDNDEKFYGNDQWKQIENIDYAFDEISRKLIGFKFIAPIEPSNKINFKNENKLKHSIINLSKLLA
jgi:16S rRNA (guanine527-N7)-methyltransferase